MRTLLHIDSSPMIENIGFADAFAPLFVSEWKNRKPEWRVHCPRPVIDRDLARLGGVDRPRILRPNPPAPRKQTVVLNLSETFIAELVAADEYVFGVPMHNFGVPASLKLWIDQIVRAGRTFAYLDGGPKGLLDGKKATVITASGGNYDEGTAMASLNHVMPYLRTVFGFVGVTDVTFINAGGTAALNYGADRQELIRPHLESIESQMYAV